MEISQLGVTGKGNWGQTGWQARAGRIKALEEKGGQRGGGCNGLERQRCIKQQGSLLSAHCGNGVFVLLLSCPAHPGQGQPTGAESIIPGPSGGQPVIDLLSLMAGSERTRSHYSLFLGTVLHSRSKRCNTSTMG